MNYAVRETLSRAPYRATMDEWSGVATAQPLFGEWAVGESDACDDLDALQSFIHEIIGAIAAEDMCAVWHSKNDAVSPYCVAEPHGKAARGAALRVLAWARREPVRRPSWQYSDAGDFLRVDVTGDEGYVAVTASFGPSRQEERAAAKRAIDRWLPMIQAFFRVWMAQFHAESAAATLTAVVNNGGGATILVDGGAHVLFASDSANEILERRDGLCRNGGQISGSRLPDTLRLRSAIEYVTQHDYANPGESPVVALPRSQGRPLLIAIVATDKAVTRDHQGAAILYLFDPDQDIHPLAEPACRFYGLSPVETKLTCLLADGHSLAAAARSMRIREQTARSYLKQVFSKTATNRQAELVQLVLKSLVQTASRCVTKFV